MHTITIHIQEEDDIATIQVEPITINLDDAIMYLELAIDAIKNVNMN